jgi:hypothetical protein
MRILNSPVYEYVEDILREEDVHDASRVPTAQINHLPFLVIAIVLTLVHGFNVYLALFTEIALFIPVVIHIVASAVVLLIAYIQFTSGLAAHHIAMMAIVSTVSGIFGSVGALLGLLFYYIFKQKTQHFDEWFESIFPKDNVSLSEEIYDNIIEGLDENPRAYGVMPLVDVMRLGSEAQKRRALAKMTIRFHPRLAPAFKLALRDASNAIRVQAATSVAKIEKDFTTVLEKIALARKHDPENKEILYAQAKFYDDYAFTGILDDELEQLNRNRAVEGYKEYLQHDPNHQTAWVSVGRLLFRDGQPTEAAEWFKNALDRGWSSHSMLLWYFESLYITGKYKELRRAIREHGKPLSDEEDVPPQLHNAVGLWIGEAA